MSDNYISTPSNATNQATDPLAAKADATVAYTDGACKGNPGAGGWGAHLIFSEGTTQDLYGGEADTTNNRMELMGAIQALTHSPHELKLEIWTDSSYVKNGITEWIANWKKRGWKTASKKPVANQDLWQQLDTLNSSRNVSWHWVKGHAGHAGNEKADELANLGVTSNSKQDTNNAIKKKQLITADKNQVLADNDWLSFDPLGLDDFDDELEDSYLEDRDSENYSLENNALQSNEIEDSLSDNESLNDKLVNTNSLVANDKMGITSKVAEPAIIKTGQNHDPSTVADISIPKSIPMSANTMPNNDLINDTALTDNIIINNKLMDNKNTDSNTASNDTKFDGDTSRANPNFQPLLPKPIHRGEANRQLIMDTETTGLDALKGDRVVEVGIVEMIDRKFTGEKLHVYIDPQRGMDEVVIRIHGISEAFLADKPTFDKVASSLYEFMDGAEIIAHNASFDMNFLTMEFDKVGMTDFAQRVKVTDSLAMAKQQYPGQKNTLDALVRRLDVGKQDRTFHGALLDSEILAEVYLAMTGGQVTLAIEEDSQSEGGHTTHIDITNLAALLLESTRDDSANQAWYANLAEEYPEIKTNMSQY